MSFTLSTCSLEENDAQKEESSSCTLIHCVSLLGILSSSVYIFYIYSYILCKSNLHAEYHGRVLTVRSASNSQRLYIYRNRKWRNMKQKMILALLLQIHYELFFFLYVHCTAWLLFSV